MSSGGGAASDAGESRRRTTSFADQKGERYRLYPVLRSVTVPARPLSPIPVHTKLRIL
jgi:hypothetical protein